jgi:hypothetical protein
MHHFLLIGRRNAANAISQAIYNIAAEAGQPDSLSRLALLSVYRRMKFLEKDKRKKIRSTKSETNSL